MVTVREIVRTTCPRDCYDGCGIVVSSVMASFDRFEATRTIP